MKVFVLTVVIFALMTVGIFANTFIMTNMLSDIENSIKKLPRPDELDDPQATVSVYDIETAFSEKSFYLSLSMSHDDINNVEQAILSLKAAFEEKDSAAYREQLYQLKDAIKHIKRLAEISWDNVL